MKQRILGQSGITVSETAWAHEHELRLRSSVAEKDMIELIH